MEEAFVASAYMQAAREAVRQFPVDAADIELVAHSENLTFRVTAREGGTCYVLRLHRPGYSSLRELESERMWTRALINGGFPVPAALESCSGGHYALVDVPGASEQRYAGMTTWQPGVPLSEYLERQADEAQRRSIFRRFGKIAASLHGQSSGWAPPTGFVRRRLGAEELLGETPFWGRFWEHPVLVSSERQQLIESRNRLREVLRAYGEEPGQFGLIHADLTPDNIIFDGNDLAVIDFDDAAFGWHVYDIASVLFECRRARDAGSLQAALLEGYDDIRPMARCDLDMLPVFLLIRGMAIIGWYLQRPEHAQDEEFAEVKDWVLRNCESHPSM